MKTNNVMTDKRNISESYDQNIWDVLLVIDKLTRKSEAEYVERHLNSPISYTMSKDVNILEYTSTLHDAATSMIKKGVGYVVVTRHNMPFGMITEKDIVCAIIGLGTSIKNFKLEILASRPLIHTHPMQNVLNAANLMIANNVRHLPVLDARKLIGILTINDFARILSLKTSFWR
ncbi:MAG: CBS domain-containing protein [Nitrosotalea sp.]